MVKKMQGQFQAAMLTALKGTRKRTSAHAIATDFYNSWFKDKGLPYFFLFKRNLRITNLQFAELLSLVKCHLTLNGTERQPIFVSADEFKNFLAQLLSDFFDFDSPSAKNRTNIINILSSLYADIVGRFVVLNPYFGSCSVYLPPTAKLDAGAVCAEAGYIHSCGRLVYVRNMTKATEEEFFKFFDQYLDRHPISATEPALFRTYSHEDFTRWDRPPTDDEPDDRYGPDLKDGLDDVKIHIRKAHFNRLNIVIVLRTFKKRFARKRLVVPDPENYKVSLSRYKKDNNIKNPRTFFLISDSAINENSPSSKKYYICYDQLFYNCDSLQFFEEDKPAWVSHTTIPHSLAAAMINITRPWPQKSHPQRLIDPFGGTGTVLLESFKHPNLEAHSSDHSPLAVLATKDNLRFFSSNAEQIKGLIQTLAGLTDTTRLLASMGLAFNQQKQDEDFLAARKTFDLVAQRSKLGLEIAAIASTSLQKLSFTQRMIFYILMRTELRHVAERNENRSDWPTAFQHELKDVLRRMNAYVMHIDRSTNGKTLSSRSLAILHAGDYSNHCCVNVPTILANSKDSTPKFVRIHDATSLPKNAYDLIITDPPYGFNTQEEDEALARLYKNFIWSAVRAIRDGGHLVICCPEYSYSGKHVPVFAQPEFVTQLILLAADDCGKAIQSERWSLPSELRGLKAPYYWEAPTALRRSILHFEISWS